VDRVVHPVHGSTVNPSEGYALIKSEPLVRDPTAQDACVRGAAASAPERKTARRRLAGVAPGQCSQPPIRPRAGALRSRNTCARDMGLRGNARAPMTANAGRGRRGRSGELVSAPMCTRRRGNELGILLTVRRRGRRAPRRREGDGAGAWKWRRVGRGSGVVGARLLKAPGTKTCGSVGSMSAGRSTREK
jgi:hypothetical protein